MHKQAYSWLVAIAMAGMFITLVLLAFSIFKFPLNPAFFTIVLSLLGITSLYRMHRSICIPFLLATFSVLAILRILGLQKHFIPMIPAGITLLCLVILFFYIAYHDVKQRPILLQGNKEIYNMSAYEWHLSFIRIYVGYDLIAHCTEKLFAGVIPWFKPM